ncbi:DNA alkylation repair protein [Flavobacterium sp. 5]|uniref:DNA alkylation repair protein n=1 Tax=Flavobacterium sp. 5 TaxID=2035199 RepID=UPI000C2CE09F|nr:DNA alkylation repair protein [Flavobacterium sp. 5]PKB15854.1 3-methyladenine DNA glycosylase AlkC [Flavobacterium sp. 5]
MATELKEMFNKKFYEHLATQFNKADAGFDTKQFVEAVTNGLESRSLNERLRFTTITLKNHLPADFKEAVQLLNTVIPNTAKGYTSLIFPDYVGQYGVHDFETSMEALTYYTQFGSSEFAIREFLKHDFDKTLEMMKLWAESPNHHIRRLASEGCRPRLPWAMALPELKKNPEPILSLLTILKSDSSEYVRRSVANNLNDIAKDNPQIVIEIATKWKGQSKETDAIIKHACRTLLKQGNIDILKHFGLDSSKVAVANFKIATPKVTIGNALEFSFFVQNNDDKPQTIRLEYAIYYLRQNGQLSKKVFKISERILESNQSLHINRKQSFKIITTRKFYTGQQMLSIIVNGEEKDSLTFELID